MQMHLRDLVQMKKIVKYKYFSVPVSIPRDHLQDCVCDVQVKAQHIPV